MAGKLKTKPHQQVSEIRKFIQESSSKVENLEDDFFVISFRHLDKKQASDFYTWEGNGMLAHAMDVLCGYCQNTLVSQYSEKFTVYGAYPTKKSAYTCPSYIPEDANWARIHITGKQIVAGHIVKNVFYIVFLDSEHQFYQTDLQDRGK